MILFAIIQTFFTICSALSGSLQMDCSQHQPFRIIRDDGSKSSFFEDLSPYILNNDNFDVDFYLYTFEKPDMAIKIQMQNNTTVENLLYNNASPLVVIIHGWLGNGTIGSARAIKRSIFQQKNPTNIIVVDWSGPANDESYMSAPAKVPYVGQKVGQFLLWFTTVTDTNLDKVHIVGYDLGAHIAGFAGRTTEGNVGRITGLDPISPCFKGTGFSLRKSDGKYVEVIHTDCAYVRSVGIIMPIGHADFYPNNCNLQPGCEDSVCSHGRAYELFAASVVHNDLMGYRCNNIWDLLKSTCKSTETFNMGNIHHDKQGAGLYSLDTAGEWPFELVVQRSDPEAYENVFRRKDTPEKKHPKDKEGEEEGEKKENEKKEGKKKGEHKKKDNGEKSRTTIGSKIWGKGEGIFSLSTSSEWPYGIQPEKEPVKNHRMLNRRRKSKSKTPRQNSSRTTIGSDIWGHG